MEQRTSTKTHRSEGRPQMGPASADDPGHRRNSAPAVVSSISSAWLPSPISLAALGILAVVVVLAVRFPS